jgi:hypothetical protein
MRKAGLLVLSKAIGKNHFLEPNFYLFNVSREELPDVRSVLFELNNPEFIHLGDHLFFLPIIKSFVAAGYHVKVSVSKTMFNFVNRLQLPLVSEGEPYGAYDLVISRFELMPELAKYKSLLVHVSQNLKMPICSQLLHSFSQYFERRFASQVEFDPFNNPTILKQLQLPENKKLVLFNVYCDSSAYLVGRRQRAQLIKTVERYASDPNYQVVFVGGLKDKLADRGQYGFSHIDLRGKTNVVELFELVRHPNVELYIGFDAFVMHLFSLSGKNSLVKFRGRITKKQSTMLSKYHVNLFSDHQFVTLI